MAFTSMERWNMSLYDLDGRSVLESRGQLNCLARQCYQLCANMVRHM